MTIPHSRSILRVKLHGFSIPHILVGIQNQVVNLV
jgi:hypothetical protein